MKKFLGCFLAVLLYLCTCAFSVLPANADQIDEKRYGPTAVPYGGTITETKQERIDYAYKVEEDYHDPFEAPIYVSNYSCGITAGGVIVGFFDRLYEELIPNHTGRYIFGKYFYGPQGDEVDAMFTSLYNSMGATPEGVTINGYKTGLQSYVQGKGRNITYENTMNGTGLDAKYKTALKNGKLLTIFVDGFNIVDFGEFTTHDKYDNLVTYVSQGAHIMVAYGYLDVKYYNAANVNFRTDTYLYAQSGFTSATLCFVRLNNYITIDDCYITQIY